MSGVRRIFVEKKEGFNVEARSLLSDFRDNLLINGLKNLRVILRYDVEGLSDEEFQAALNTVFSEPPVDKVYLEELPVGEGEYAFGVEYLAGQFDQRSDSAAQCVQLLTTGRRPEVAAAKIYALEGYLRSADIEKIKRYVINPVDSKEAGMDKPKTLKMELPEPPDVKIAAGFSRFTDEELEAFRREGGYAMSLNDLAFTREYFGSEGRDPYITELRVIDTYWSDHCRHTTFLTELTEVDFEEGPVGAKVREVYNHYLALRNEVYGGRKKPVTLMDMATVYVKAMKKRGLLKKLDDSEEINACSFKHTLRTKEGDKEYLILFKNETHNHPTEIEPFGGAATCLGGAIRDPLSGRAYVYQAMRVTGSGDPREKTQDTLPHKLPQRKITKGAAAGYSSYGNQIGLATGLVRELYHPGYKAKRMEIGAVIAATPKENVRRERPEEGDIVVLIGGRTGRDGIGGATGSSKAHTTESTEACGAEVQKGNAPTERKLQRLFRKKEFTRLVKRCNDFGAGGVSVAIGELADSLDIQLDAVLKKYDGLDGTELAISESQERMAVVVEKEHLSRVIALAEEENLEAVKVAEVTNTGCMRMFWRNKNIVNIKRAFLNTNGAAQYAKARIASPDIKSYLETEVDGSLKEAVKAILSDLNVCSQKGLIELFDSTIGAGTVHMPLGGRTQLTPAQAMAALVSTEGSISKDATLMSFGLDPYLMEKSPFHGAVYSVVASIAKIVAAGGTYQNTWLTLQEYFESLGSDPLKWGRPASALLGALYAQQGFSVVSIGGKDSMSGTYEDLTVPPTLCSFAVAVESAEELVSGEFKKAGDSLYLLELDSDQLSLPVFETMKKKYDVFYELVKEGKVKAAYAVEQGASWLRRPRWLWATKSGWSWKTICLSGRSPERNTAPSFLKRKRKSSLLILTGSERSLKKRKSGFGARASRWKRPCGPLPRLWKRYFPPKRPGFPKSPTIPLFPAFPKPRLKSGRQSPGWLSPCSRAPTANTIRRPCLNGRAESLRSSSYRTGRRKR